jgi:hypothetical protein
MENTVGATIEQDVKQNAQIAVAPGFNTSIARQWC